MFDYFKKIKNNIFTMDMNILSLKNKIMLFLQNKLFDIYFSYIFILTKFEIFTNYFMKKIKSNQNIIAIKNKFITKEKEYILEFVKDGNIIEKIERSEFEKDIFKLEEIYKNINYDFVIYTDYNPHTISNYDVDNDILNSNECCLNKLIIKDINSIKNIKNIKYSVSNVNFVLLELMYEDKKIKIELKTKKYNYLITNNIIDNTFFYYFLVKYHNYVKNKNDFLSNNYSVFIIDSNININTIDNTYNINILENDYTMFSNNIK